MFALPLMQQRRKHGDARRALWQELCGHAEGRATAPRGQHGAGKKSCFMSLGGGARPQAFNSMGERLFPPELTHRRLQFQTVS